MQKQLQAGVEATAVQINLGMPVMKESGARWLTALYDKLRFENSIIINGFKNVGIIAAVKDARENFTSDEELLEAEDPFEDVNDT